MSELFDRVRAAIEPFPLDDMDPNYEETLTAATKAAIEAMRDPTPAMCKAAHGYLMTHPNQLDDMARAVWQEMLEAEVAR